MMILDDVDLIKSLQQSKATSDYVKIKLQDAEVKQAQNEVARMQYFDVSIRGTLLYFVVADLTMIDPMYQFSLNYFQKLFKQVI